MCGFDPYSNPFREKNLRDSIQVLQLIHMLVHTQDVEREVNACTT